ncbi:hypothetical protein RD792_002653 [Penstemon davidsonii]|uniref:Cation/H+ exchanger transmembrane domain-containing protein n=1 Tax=Penstemon davidsonii TaxID=160366 RepID=A0ABR0DSM9_9LAMI|nr:hypothetical protein RD792_002653 [Penstemon davidsonii]
MEELHISPADPRGSPAKEQQAAGVGILLQIMMLVLSFVLGHVLRRHRFYYLPEASASLLIGLTVGVLANISNTENNIRAWFNFHEEFFFLFLLPPIILYPCAMDSEGSISLTSFRAYSIGVQSATYGVMTLSTTLSIYVYDVDIGSLSHCRAVLKPFFSNFGAIVTFAIFGTFVASVVTGILVYLGGVTFLMYKLPFVECLMFGALISATDPVTVLSIFQELGTDVNLYALVFGESVLNDAMAISLYRTMSLVRSHTSGQSLFMLVVRFLETFVGSMSAGVGVGFTSALISFLSSELGVLYMLAEGLGLSGIVSILFTGILFIGIARAANVFSCAYLVNLVRPAHRKIPMKHQKALWYSGLRGAMAFALALQSVHDLPEGHGQTIFTATTAIVVLTVLLIGGSTGTMLENLQVVGDEHDGPLGESFEANNGYIAPTYDGESSSGNRFKMKLKEFHNSASSFTALDKNYLTPFFTSHGGDEDEQGKMND